MSDPHTRARPPLTLIANAQEWHSRSLESILAPHGHAVLRAYTAKQTLERAASARPDLIIVDTNLPDRDGFSAVRELRAMRDLSPCMPILMTTTGTISRQKRIDALRAGAWDFIGATLDAEELTLKLDVYLESKREADRARDVGLLDDNTGLYNLRGLSRRVREISSQAFRQREPLACIVISPMADNEAASAPELLEWLAQSLRTTGRTSDIIGMVGPNELAIVANGTNAAGIERLAERVAQAVSERLAAEGVGLAMGYEAVENYAESPIDPTDLLTNAFSAMRSSRSDSAPRRRVSLRKFEADSLN